MFKKIISGILSVSMAAAMAATAFAAVTEPLGDAVTGWSASNVQYPDGNTNPLGVEIVTKDTGMVPSGEGALHVYGTANINAYNANAAQNVSALTDGESYRLTGKLYATITGYRSVFRIGSKELVRTEYFTAKDKLSQWIDIDYTFTYVAATYNSKDFKIQIAGNGDIYADDLSLRKVITAEDGTVTYGEELLVNGDFEMDFEAPDEAEYVSVAARNGANYIAVKTAYPGTEIYQVGSDGTQTKLELTSVLTTAKYNLNVYAHTGLTNNKVYNYLVKTVGANGISSEGVAASGMPSSKYDDYITANNWTYKHNGDNYGIVAFEQGIGYGGSNAMKLTNMSDSSSNGAYLYIINASKLSLEKDKVYKLSFKAKSGVRNTLADSFAIRMSNAYSSLDGATYATAVNKDIKPLTVSGDGQWAEQTGYFKAADIENTMEIRVHRHFENLVLDDFTLYEVDENLNVVTGAANLFADKNGNFETLDLPEFKAEYKFYPAYADEEQFGEIMDPSGISSLSDLADYDTAVLYSEAVINNELYTAGKDYSFIVAIYRDNALYDTRIIEGNAAYLPAGSEGEKIGFAYKLPDLSDADYKVKIFMWNDITPLASKCGLINEN